MTAISNLSDLITRATGGSSGTPENLWFFKSGRSAGVALSTPTTGKLHSMWIFDGQPGNGAVPTSAAIPDNLTAGALEQADPGGGRQKWLYSFGTVHQILGTVILYDRLLHCGGFSGTVTTAQTVQGATPTPALTRYNTNATCVGNQIAVEIYTTVGSTATTITASYTNQDGTANRTTLATSFGGSSGNGGQGRLITLPLQSGDTGVQAVKDVTIAASTTTAGNFGVTIMRPLALVSTAQAGIGAFRDFTVGLPGIPEVLTDACLALAFIPGQNTAGDYFGCASFVEA